MKDKYGTHLCDADEGWQHSIVFGSHEAEVLALGVRFLIEKVGPAFVIVLSPRVLRGGDEG